MEYFTFFPETKYIDKNIIDISVRLNFFSKIKANTLLYEYKLIKDGQKPEDVATEYYNDPTLYWIVLIVNDIIDPFYEWVLSERRLYEYIKAKYGDNQFQTIHHYETTDEHALGAGLWVDSTEPFSTPVSVLTYESFLNEKKRKIKLIKTRYLPQVLAEYERVLREIN